MQMGNLWETYYVVFFAGVFVIAGPIGFLLYSWTIRPKGVFQAKEQRPLKINTRYFIAINISLLLIASAFLLVLCASALKFVDEKKIQTKGFFSVVFIAVTISIGLMYSARKGDLSWLWTYKKWD